ncbi:MAG TPA: thermonuclease family protein [Acidimicrobiales bacterium]|nr:thermonuclease family protein [Acidimicrobiales bacterium]
MSDAAAAPATTTTAVAKAVEVPVRSVTDGDTLTLVDGRTVRLAQVDAPETNECFGSQSTVALQRLAKDKPVVVRRPTDGPEKEKYGRTLAEVMVGTLSVNEALVREGAAEWYEQFAREDADLARRLRAAEEEARASGRGLWSACSNTRSAAPTTQRPPSGNGSPAGGNCHPAYPDDCIPPAPPDLNCGDLRRAVRVDHRSGDPHGLDANDDGWGCESYR